MSRYTNCIIMENDIVKVEFDNVFGTLLSLENKKTGWKIQSQKELALSFRMLIPLPERRNNKVHGEKQKPSSIDFNPADNRIIFIWENIESEYGGVHDIRLKATVDLDDSGLSFNAEIENRSPYSVENLSYPCLGDLPMPSPDEKLTRINSSYAQISRTPLLPLFTNEKGDYGIDYPIQMVSAPDNPFILIDSGKQGLYAGYHNTSFKELVVFTFEFKPGLLERITGAVPITDEISGLPVHMEFSAVHFPYALPGETVKATPIVLNVYNGTWHKGVDCYKQWRKTWFTPPHTAEWARDVHSWQQIHINSPEDELRCRYTDLVKYGEDCARHGVKAIQLVGWNNGGQDRGNPSHDTDPRLGTREELKEVIRKIENMGVRMIIFSKFTWADRSQEWFRSELINYAVKDPYGDYYMHPGYQYQTPAQLADINTRRLIPMCMNSKKWRDICCEELEKVLDLGASGMLYDECFHHGGTQYCFDSEHGHHVPENVYSGDALLCEDFYKLTEKTNPDFLYAGEALYDHQFKYYSLSYFRVFGLDHVSLQRYIEPYANIMLAVSAHDDRNILNMCLLFRYVISYEPYYFKGRLDDFPLTIEYGKKIDGLRKKYKEFLWDGEYIDTLEASVTLDSDVQYTYSVFKQPGTGRHAVIVVNYDMEKEIEVTVKVDNYSDTFSMVTPENQEPVDSDGTAHIPPRSAVVLMEK